MPRKRLTQLFPALLPLRRWQRKTFFYWHLYWDANHYAQQRIEHALPYEVFQASSEMLNEHSGFPMEYQYNKVHNLRLAAEKLDHLVVKPGEVFSFCLGIRGADRQQPYKKGLVLTGGKIIGEYGGGLCQMSNLLFWMFLHTPMYIVERHEHPLQSFPIGENGLPYGTDATVNEGWLDLKVENQTQHTFQIEVTLDEKRLYGRILSDCVPHYQYEIFNREISYFRRTGTIFQEVSVDCRRTESDTGVQKEFCLYREQSQIGYPLPEQTMIVERGEAI